VTALCITRNRREWLPKAIQCFQKQTYPACELLIVSDGADVRDLVPPDERIRHIHIEGSANIGEKRNFGCDRARGEIIAHWDDDDYSAPGRLVDQCARLRDSGKAVTVYHTLRFIGYGDTWLYSGNFAGTTLAYRRDWWMGHRFPSKHIAEDEGFIKDAMLHGEFSSSDAGDLMYATNHDQNTSPRAMHGSKWRKL